METIITNNPKVYKEFSGQFKVEFDENMDQTKILCKARNYVHLGAKLIIHPMMGRIKPHETPYKSVFLNVLEGELDLISLTIIEDSIRETDKLLNATYRKKYDDQLLNDLQYIDYLLIRTGIDEYSWK